MIPLDSIQEFNRNLEIWEILMNQIKNEQQPLLSLNGQANQHQKQTIKQLISKSNSTSNTPTETSLEKQIYKKENEMRRTKVQLGKFWVEKYKEVHKNDHEEFISEILVRLISDSKSISNLKNNHLIALLTKKLMAVTLQYSTLNKAFQDLQTKKEIQESKQKKLISKEESVQFWKNMIDLKNQNLVLTDTLREQHKKINWKIEAMERQIHSKMHFIENSFFKTGTKSNVTSETPLPNAKPESIISPQPTRNPSNQIISKFPKIPQITNQNHSQTLYSSNRQIKQELEIYTNSTNSNPSIIYQKSNYHISGHHFLNDSHKINNPIDSSQHPALALSYTPNFEHLYNQRTSFKQNSFLPSTRIKSGPARLQNSHNQLPFPIPRIKLHKELPARFLGDPTAAGIMKTKNGQMPSSGRNHRDIHRRQITQPNPRMTLNGQNLHGLRINSPLKLNGLFVNTKNNHEATQNRQLTGIKRDYFQIRDPVNMSKASGLNGTKKRIKTSKSKVGGRFSSFSKCFIANRLN